MKNLKTKLLYSVTLAVGVSILLILRQYADYLINDYDYEFSWYAISSRIAINYLFWAVLIVFLIVPLSNKLLSSKIGMRTVLLQIICSVGIALAHRLVVVRLNDFAYFLNTNFLRSFLTPGNQVQIGVGWISSLLEYWIIMALLLALGYYKRYSEKEKELNQAQLNALRMQLQPHFLFNTLNSIASLIDIDPKKAQKMLAQLGYLMRKILEQDKQHFITLESEMAYIKAYLDIEYIRFRDRLSLQFNIDESCLQAQVPALILQPIIENAIKHGISRSSEGGNITIKTEQVIKRGENHMCIQIINDFPKQHNGHPQGYGIGTSNVARRLKQLYQEDHSYTQEILQNKYISEITIPIKLSV